ncbi:MAG: KH domain-containing protein [Candidatus Micrarchaeia archaeon]
MISMQQLLIPVARAQILQKDPKKIAEIEKVLKCKLELKEENILEISGEPYDEYNARNVLSAYGRGFSIEESYKLLDDSYVFSSINLKEIFGNESQIHRFKSRIIGTEGRTKKYIESVSGAHMCVYGNSVSLIGTLEELKIANAAINVLLEGGTHKKAYRLMELERRRQNNISM